MEKRWDGNDTSASDMKKGLYVLLDISSENATSTSTSEIIKSPSRGKKNITNHAPKPTIREKGTSSKTICIAKNVCVKFKQ